MVRTDAGSVFQENSIFKAAETGQDYILLTKKGDSSVVVAVVTVFFVFVQQDDICIGGAHQGESNCAGNH